MVLDSEKRFPISRILAVNRFVEDGFTPALPDSAKEAFGMKLAALFVCSTVRSNLGGSMKTIVTALIGIVLVSGTAMAGNADAGKIKAGTCTGCHGVDGISAVPNYPNLKGQKEQYLVKSLRAYREGRRTDPVMSPMARPLSDRDIDNLAAHFSRL